MNCFRGRLVCRWLASAFAVPAQQPSANAPYTFHRTVRRVILDVVVLDKSHIPVTGLARQDFSVFEDDRPNSFDPSRKSTLSATAEEPPNQPAALTNPPLQP